MLEEQDLLALLIDKIEYQIKLNKDNLKGTKHDIKKLEKSKDGAIEAGIEDYVFDNKINYINSVKETLEERINILKKIKYRLVVSEKMLNSLK